MHVIAARYQLGREIGRGGMGAVWLGRDLLLQRDVALKEVGLLPGSDEADLERVRREAQVSAMLNHPNVVAVFDLAAEDGRHWLVMEYVDCETLSDRVRRSRHLTPDELAPLVAQAAHALAAAHEAGVVHRDVKPNNMLIGRDGILKLGDFGIARTTADPALTRTGLVTGSPGYMAPEVASGGTATAASDVWSLGATVYHALEGRPPYETDQNLMAALYRLVHEEPPRTDRAEWLEPLLRATMHRDPAGRWTAAQVAAFLDRGREGQPPPVGPPTVVAAPVAVDSVAADSVTAVDVVASPATASSAETTQLIERRRGWPVAAGAGAVAVLLLGVVLAVTLLNDDPPRTGAEDSPTDSVTTVAPPPARPTAAGMESFITDYLATVAEDPVVAWTRLTASFQRASGGYDAYIAWWGGLEKAEVKKIEADPDNLTVSYEVEYDWAKGEGKGKLRRDDPTLELTFDDGTYRIDYETG